MSVLETPYQCASGSSRYPVSHKSTVEMYVLRKGGTCSFVTLLRQAASTRGQGGALISTSLPRWVTQKSERLGASHTCRGSCSHDPAHAWSVGCLTGFAGVDPSDVIATQTSTHLPRKLPHICPDLAQDL